MFDPWLYNSILEMLTRAMNPDQIKNHQQRSALFGMELQSLMGVFNAHPAKPVA